MTARLFIPYHRRGTAGGYTYTAVIGPGEGRWGWGGHRYLTGTTVHGFGDKVAGGGPFNDRDDAGTETDKWFYGIPNIVEPRDGI